MYEVAQGIYWVGVYLVKEANKWEKMAWKEKATIPAKDAKIKNFPFNVRFSLQLHSNEHRQPLETYIQDESH